MADKRTFVYENFEMSYEETKKDGLCLIRITIPIMKYIYCFPEKELLLLAIPHIL